MERLTEEQIKKAVAVMGDKWGYCPRCGGPLEADEVDVGVGMMQCSAKGCPNCYWVEGDQLPMPKETKA